MSHVKHRLDRIELLQSVPIDGIEHLGQRLSEHLIGTHDLLREWGNAKHVCLAGLFHSIYGTKTFAHTDLTIRSRDRIRQLIGPDAEMLVYIFCMSDRKRLLLENQSPPYNWTNHRTGQKSRITDDVLNELVEIEVANFVDQLPFRKTKPDPVLTDMLHRFEIAKSRMTSRAAAAFSRAVEDHARTLGATSIRERQT